MAEKVIDRMLACKHHHTSKNGNPSYTVELQKSGTRLTMSDAMFSYGLTNRENFENDLEITFTKAGRIRTLRPITEK